MARKPLDRANPSRRSVLLGAVAATGALARPVLAQTATLQVVTSFPEELTTRYEQEFEKTHAGAHVQFVWKQSRDALEQLSRADQGGADVGCGFRATASQPCCHRPTSARRPIWRLPTSATAWASW